MPFSQAPCGLFLPHSDFYLRLRKDRLMALFYRLPFPYDSRPPKITGFAYADKIHVFWPFRLATLVCSPARCGCLTPSLIAPKRTGEFSFVRATKTGFPQKRLFVSRCCGFRCLFLIYWLFFVFTIYRLSACVPFLKVCIFFVSVFPVCLSGLFPFRVQFNSKTNFSNRKIFFRPIEKNGSKMRVNARARWLFLFDWKSIHYKKVEFFFQKNIGFNVQKWTERKTIYIDSQLFVSW